MRRVADQPPDPQNDTEPRRRTLEERLRGLARGFGYRGLDVNAPEDSALNPDQQIATILEEVGACASDRDDDRAFIAKLAELCEQHRRGRVAKDEVGFKDHWIGELASWDGRDAASFALRFVPAAFEWLPNRLVPPGCEGARPDFDHFSNQVRIALETALPQPRIAGLAGAERGIALLRKCLIGLGLDAHAAGDLVDARRKRPNSGTE